ncbi:MAG: LysR family transcriptional regulator [Burkholderiales bacterium]|nr:LysR family transcriptional regulator [Burkholderiales bacterium]MDE1928642.1 LysR family transcriptional regulator [Burkholderiales bacterium]MDE2504884.1 LysR family transcriptional regulator [Burkholderiales bacterium]
MFEIQRARVGNGTAPEVPGDRLIEPGAAAATVEIAGADDDRAQARCAAALQFGFHRAAQLALARRRTLRRRRGQAGRHRRAVVVDIARQHQPRAEALGQRQALVEQRLQFRVPARVGGIDGVDDIAVRMVRPAQGSLIVRKLGDIAIATVAHESYLARHGTPRDARELLQHHRLIGYDRDEAILRGFARMGVTLRREQFALRTDDQVAYVRLVEAGAGIGFIAAYTAGPGVRALLPALKIPPLPCWLAVHREIRGNPVVRRVYDFLAAAIPAVIDRSG